MPRSEVDGRDGRQRRVPIIVQGLRLGLFGAGLGGIAAVLIIESLPKIGAKPSLVLVFGAGLLTAVSCALLLHDTLRPELPNSRR